MSSLTVFYDARCGLCVAVRDWLRTQRQLVPLEFRPKSGGADLVVRADSGEVWEGDTAWLVVLWALAKYRPVANRLASPALLPLARRTFAKLSDYRGAISCELGLTPDRPAPSLR